MSEVKIKEMVVKNEADNDDIPPWKREVSIKFIVNNPETLARIQELVMRDLSKEDSNQK